MLSLEKSQWLEKSLECFASGRTSVRSEKVNFCTLNNGAGCLLDIALNLNWLKKMNSNILVTEHLSQGKGAASISEAVLLRK